MRKIFIKRLKKKVDAGSIYFKHFNFEVFDYALYPSYEGDKEVCLERKGGREEEREKRYIISLLQREHYSAMSRVMTEDIKDISLNLPCLTASAEIKIDSQTGDALWQYASHRGTLYTAKFNGEWEFSIKEEV